MSHFTRVKTKIVELLYLKRALSDLNLQFEEGKVKIRGYMGKKTSVDLRIRTPEGYDVGFVKVGDSYEVVADWDMVRTFSKEAFVKEVSRHYAYHVVKDQLEVQDFKVVEERRQGQAVSLTLRRM
ncbi:MAG: DUF1257 domain-containing protein [Chloroflexi bacterium]|nr:DUF1257 domain-containing protein [Deltaproteobacteria bacterium]MBI5290529.1 DUF1257 domain-containing protein [Chloroflexota bacterium]